MFPSRVLLGGSAAGGSGAICPRRRSPNRPDLAADLKPLAGAQAQRRRAQYHSCSATWQEMEAIQLGGWSSATCGSNSLGAELICSLACLFRASSGSDRIVDPIIWLSDFQQTQQQEANRKTGLLLFFY